MEQQIRFCTTSDGVSIAYATLGDGPPLVYANGWPTHLELEWETPSSRSFLEDLAQGRTLIRYDMRGTGLSDRDVSDFSVDALVKDLEAVVDHLKLDKFDLVSLGSLAGPIAMSYAAESQQRIKRLLLSSAFVRGHDITTPDRQRAMIGYAAQFGYPLFGFVDSPHVDTEVQRDVLKRQKAAASPEVQAALLRTLFSVDVSGLLDRLTMPILVLHGRQDAVVPFDQGRELAARLPQARFVPFEGQSSMAWAQRNIIVPEIRRFLGVKAVAREERAFRTILFTDVEGSTALTDCLGDAKARELLREHERLVRDALKAHGGSEVKAEGDGFMLAFGSARKALDCAVDIQRAFARRNESADEPIRVRIGLHTGEALKEDEDFFGKNVILAARIASQAQGGEILVSSLLKELTESAGNIAFGEGRELELKGLSGRHRVFEVAWQKPTSRSVH